MFATFFQRLRGRTTKESSLLDKIGRLNRKLVDARERIRELEAERLVLVESTATGEERKRELLEQYERQKSVIMVDVDGTLAQWAYPDLGEPMPGAIGALGRAREAGFTIGVWSSRMDRTIYTEAEVYAARRMITSWLNRNGIPYDFVDLGLGGKRLAIAYIDDRSVHLDEGLGGRAWDIAMEHVHAIRNRAEQKHESTRRKYAPDTGD